MGEVLQPDGHPSVSLIMGADDITAGGEVVYLLAELRSEQGPVHEIGSRARVLEAAGDQLTLTLGYGRFESIVTCSRSLVAAKRRSLPARRGLRADRWSAA